MLNYSNVLMAAKKKVEESNKGQGGNFLYPANGGTRVRFLINPKSGLVFRTIARHWDEDNSRYVPCLEMYGLPCPICALNAKYKAKTGNELDWRYKAQKRSLSYVTYHSADEPHKTLKQGDTALFTAPSSVEKQMSTILSNIDRNDYGTEEEYQKGVETYLEKLLANKETNIITITKSKKGNLTEYSTVVHPFNQMKSAESDEEMNKLLEELPNLNEALFPSKVTDEIKNKANVCAIALEKKLGIEDDVPPVPGE